MRTWSQRLAATDERLETGFRKPGDQKALIVKDAWQGPQSLYARSLAK